MDNRAQPIGIGRYFVVLVAITIIWVLVSRPFNMVLGTARNRTTNQTALTGLQYQETLFNALPFIFLFISGLGLIVIAVFRQRGGI